MNSFKLQSGFEMPIVPGFREQVKSNWRKGFKTFEYQPIAADKVNNLKNDVKNASNILSKLDIPLQGKKIMDIGCYLGIQCFGAMELGAESAVGIDIPEYYINASSDKEINASQILTQRRDDIRKFHPHLDQSKISFEDTSVFEMDYENEFDIIFSWETFEHITNPEEALKRIHKALKPGGISFNAYNPFFCISGGHSMCTLDFPFAHALMTNEDFKKYIDTVPLDDRPENYSEMSYDFFTKGLNRMTMADLANYITDTGFETLSFLPIPDMNIMNILDPSVLEASKKLYPNIQLNDFLCSNIYFILKK